tara:strand:+ start:755 stop:1066 length:312 start_codon:yes stop_codon:yes gene_type:complete
MGIKLVNGIETPLTAEEEAEIVEKNSNANRTARKLEDIKDMRLDRLKETDWYSNSDVTMSDAMKTWRQSLRDIPANHTDEAAYDLLLARDADGNLTHSVWSKP